MGFSHAPCCNPDAVPVVYEAATEALFCSTFISLETSLAATLDTVSEVQIVPLDANMSRTVKDVKHRPRLTRTGS